MTDADGISTDIVLGPRTTVFALRHAYPGLVEFLPAYDAAFRRVEAVEGGRTWSRATTLGDVALDMNVTWRRLVRDIAAEVGRQTGRQPLTVDDDTSVSPEDPRLGELRDIALRLERGGSLVELAERFREVTAGADERESESLDAALRVGSGEPSLAGDRRLWDSLSGQTSGDLAVGPPEGHPVDSLRREGAQLDLVTGALRAQLERLGGSPTRRRWGDARPLVERLVAGMAGLETRVRRVREAWLPALAARGEDGVAALVHDRHAAAFEALRLLRLALARDDPASVVEHGTGLLDSLQELRACEEQVLEPAAERAFTPGDWVEVRLHEDGVGWWTIPRPAPWPPG